MKKILLIATMVFTMNANAGVDMFSDGKCLSDAMTVAKYLKRSRLNEDEIREILTNTKVPLLLDADCLTDLSITAVYMMGSGFTEDEIVEFIGGRIAYEIIEILDDLFR